MWQDGMGGRWPLTLRKLISEAKYAHEQIADLQDGTHT
jgi:hypothetical protein